MFWRKRFSSLRSQLVVVGLLPLIGLVVAIGLLSFSLNLLSSARAYVGGESLWAKSQKEATYSLYKYSSTRSEDDYQAAMTSLRVTYGDKQARLELDKANPDLNIVRAGFIQGGIHPADIDGMIFLYRNFKSVSYFARPIDAWRRGDELIARLQSEAEQLHTEVQSASSRAVIVARMTRIDAIDKQVVILENQFSSLMGEASRWVRDILIQLTALVLLFVTLITFRVVNSINRRSVREIGIIQSVARAAAGGDYSKKMENIDTAEFASLAHDFNTLVSTVSKSRQSLEMVVKETAQQNTDLENTKRAILNILEDLDEEKRLVDTQRLKDEALLQSIGEGLVATDSSGVITTVNPVACQLLGLTESEMIGVHFAKAWQIADIEGKALQATERPAMKALMTGQPDTQEMRYSRKDGATLPVSVTASPILQDGQPAGVIIVFRDITNELELERAKEEFVSLASHQLRTPATGVKAFTSMLMDGYAGKLTKQQMEFLGKIYDSNERQLRIVDDMLNVARIDAGRMVLQYADVDPVTLAKNTISEQSEVLAQRNQKLEFKPPTKARKVRLDPDKVRMVLDNLVSNASKYTNEGGSIIFDMKLEDKKLTISVSDTGVGIKKSDLPKLFQRFSRIDNTRSAIVGGTGLGLYIVKQIVELHKGKIGVASEPGKGTTFTVEFPIVNTPPTGKQKDDS